MRKIENFYQLKCVKCKRVVLESESVTSCPSCEGPLDVIYDYDYIKSHLNFFSLKNAPLSHQKYVSLFPINDFNQIVSLKEGGTPLLKAEHLAKKFGIKDVFIKNEGANPTGVFKDRGTMVEITKAKELGAKAIIVASTGNMAASVAAYSAQAKLPCYVLAPEGTPIGKLSQTLAFGARIIQIRGTYTDCAKLAAMTAKRHGFYLAGDYAFRCEGQKSQGYEIAEQLFWKAPDFLICPVGCGTNLSAIYKGFKEFFELGFIDKLPRLVAVQPYGCNPITKAYKEKKRNFKPVDKPETVASAIAAGNPLDGVKVLKAMYDSRGIAVEVSDEEILEAGKNLASKESIYVEPSGALPAVAFEKLVSRGTIKKDHIVVLMATGNGLKDPKTMLRILPAPASVEPNQEDIDDYLDSKLYQIQSSGATQKGKILFKRKPLQKNLKEKVKKEFSIVLNKGYLKEVDRGVKDFFIKKNEMQKSDLQHIIEDAIKSLPDSEKIISIKNFEVTTSKDAKAVAKVEMKCNGKVCDVLESDGVGPVDAIMRACRKFIREQKLLKYWLIDYDVKIDEKGTDATVEVSMTLKDDHGNRVISTATSPDVVAASIDAFEKGYNILYNKSKASSQ